MHSPRSLEACKSEGVNPEKLRYKPLNAFASPVKPQSLHEIEFDRFEILIPSKKLS